MCMWSLRKSLCAKKVRERRWFLSLDDIDRWVSASGICMLSHPFHYMNIVWYDAYTLGEASDTLFPPSTYLVCLCSAIADTPLPWSFSSGDGRLIIKLFDHSDRKLSDNSKERNVYHSYEKESLTISLSLIVKDERIPLYLFQPFSYQVTLESEKDYSWLCNKTAIVLFLTQR